MSFSPSPLRSGGDEAGARALRRVLIVSPSFPPVNAADHQRVRMSLPYLREFGWETTVLAVVPEAVEGGSLDDLLLDSVPADISVVKTSAIPHSITRRVGLGSLAFRSLPFLKRAGNKLLKDGDFDLVFFSTTYFPVMILGPHWLRTFGVPYVVDFQDPWLDDYYERTGTPPPGGRLRHGLMRAIAAQLEPRVMRHVSKVISVSPAYVPTFQQRYPHLRDEQFSVLPFGAPEYDFELLARASISQPVFDKKDGKRHLVYVGRAGADMRAALSVLFSGLREAVREDGIGWVDVMLHFVGTSYAPEGRAQKSVEPIAQQYDVADLVQEQTGRIGYFETLQALRDADALLVIGSDSAAYTPSKLYPYVLARRPLLFVLQRDSPAVSIMQRCRAGHMVTFENASSVPDVIQAATSALRSIRRDIESGATPDVDWQEFSLYTAREMTRKQCEVFDAAVAP